MLQYASAVFLQWVSPMLQLFCVGVYVLWKSECLCVCVGLLGLLMVVLVLLLAIGGRAQLRTRLKLQPNQTSTNCDR
jgi:multisubunit Na+/H+ antiporter MnhC subunit